MKILYALQGTGNGHLSRARDIIPILQKNHEVDILISGTQADIELPFFVKFRFTGMSFIFGDKGGVDYIKTYKKSKLRSFFSEVATLPVTDYELVINDFEPVSAWACAFNQIKCISLSHQSAVLNKNAPQPKEVDMLGKAILLNYAPSSEQYGFHFSAYDNGIFTPVIRKEIRSRFSEDKGHYTVYLPAYDDKRIIKVLKMCENVRWQVFSKQSKLGKSENNILIRPINNEEFIESMATSKGVLCGAGFETPAEALFLKKKLMVVPMKGQYEQQCNAAALKTMGVPVLKSLKPENIEKIKKWLREDNYVNVEYPDITERVITNLIEEHLTARKLSSKEKNTMKYSFKRFRNAILKNITKQLKAGN